MQAVVDTIGNRIVQASELQKTGYQFDFHLLADDKTVNAFALPGGQIFVTMGLLKLLQTEGELAGVLGHEIGHVVARHSAEHMAKAKLTEGLSGAAVMAAYDPNDPKSVGSRRTNSAPPAPLPSPSATVRVPPWASARRRARARPMPIPS